MKSQVKIMFMVAIFSTINFSPAFGQKKIIL
jgi:hypothetical protein